MSTLNVDKVDPSTGTALEIGSSGDTVSVPSGATLDISASTLTPPATMPASSGVNLTALNATNLGSGTVPTARLGTGTASSSTVLYGDQTYKAEPGGGKLELISSGNSSSLYHDFDIFDSTLYDAYYVVLTEVLGLDDETLAFQFRDSGGALGGSDYYFMAEGYRSSNGEFRTAGESVGQPEMGCPVKPSASYPAAYTFTVVDNPVNSSSGGTLMGLQWGYRQSWSDMVYTNINIWRNAASTYTGFRLLASGGSNTTSFDYQTYGLGQ